MILFLTLYSLYPLCLSPTFYNGFMANPGGMHWSWLGPSLYPQPHPAQYLIQLMLNTCYLMDLLQKVFSIFKKIFYLLKAIIGRGNIYVLKILIRLFRIVHTKLLKLTAHSHMCLSFPNNELKNLPSRIVCAKSGQPFMIMTRIVSCFVPATAFLPNILPICKDPWVLHGK